jgi:hypothetical protein
MVFACGKKFFVLSRISGGEQKAIAPPFALSLFVSKIYFLKQNPID